MDLKHTPTTAAVDSPDTDGETPLHSQLITPLSSFPNGKHNHRPPPPPPSVSYKECLKNHAATIGSHAVDGCGEFMPSPSPPQPTSLKCAACGCHRNFHRRESINHFIDFHHPSYAHAPHVLMSLRTPYHNHTVATPGTPAAIKIENPNGRKRFRTKFSQDQKEKMSNFAEKVEWKMQRSDDKMVMDFCNEIGIKRGIFKVWMHNNKNTFGKKEKDINFPTTVAAAVAAAAENDKSNDLVNNGRVVISEDVNVDGRDNSNSSDQENGGGGGGGGGRRGGYDGGVHLHASTNGSSSSS